MTNIPVERTVSSILGPMNDVQAKNAPKTLYVCGDESLLNRGPRVAIVGSRSASPDGLRRASVLATFLAERDIVVVSGLAAGIDTAAHLGAMDAGGHTIAVLGTSLDQSYPPENAALQARIAADHLLVSQFASGSRVSPKHFPMRNRTMALLTDATVIVEAGERSGTRHQGWEALRLGRLVFLLESVVKDTSLTWPAEMIKFGAQILTRENLPRMAQNLPAMTVAFDIAQAA